MERISEFTVRRLSSYYRILNDLEKKSVRTISSKKLAVLGGVSPAQVRKDLSYFGKFGTRGLGYDVKDLRSEIVNILGLHQQWTMALFGAGSLGAALFFHQGFRDDGFYFKHLFDEDPEKIGRKWGHLEIMPVGRAQEVLSNEPVHIGVITTPEEAAQEVADLLVEAGVGGILNFATRELIVPDRVGLRNVNLAVALESLSFSLSAAQNRFI
jgi:redox-sensing transcriptional repressor